MLARAGPPHTRIHARRFPKVSAAVHHELKRRVHLSANGPVGPGVVDCLVPIQSFKKIRNRRVTGTKMARKGREVTTLKSRKVFWLWCMALGWVLPANLTGEALPARNDLQLDEMVRIPATSFLMGDDHSDADVRPAHRVDVPAFFIDRREVTCEEYRRFLLANPEWRKGRVSPSLADRNYLRDWDDLSYPRGKAAYPVTWVSWHAANAYAKWRGARLPTEAEWEATARGATGRIYPWGNEDPENSEMPRANYASARGRFGRHGGTEPVGRYPAGATPEGVLDMAGNVWEWVADWHDPDYYSESPRVNPTGPSNGSYRVVRGGSWAVPSPWLRSYARLRAFPAKTSDQVGFRCARTSSP